MVQVYQEECQIAVTRWIIWTCGLVGSDSLLDIAWDRDLKEPAIVDPSQWVGQRGFLKSLVGLRQLEAAGGNGFLQPLPLSFQSSRAQGDNPHHGQNEQKTKQRACPEPLPPGRQNRKAVADRRTPTAAHGTATYFKFVIARRQGRVAHLSKRGFHWSALQAVQLIFAAKTRRIAQRGNGEMSFKCPLVIRDLRTVRVHQFLACKRRRGDHSL